MTTKQRRFVVSAHQPVLFPNNAFWEKMRRSDVFEIAKYDLYSTGRGLFSGRVNLGTEESYVQFKFKPVYTSQLGVDRICDIKLPKDYQADLWNAIKTAYYQFPRWNAYKPLIANILFDVEYKYLWEFDYMSTIRIKDLLGITTPVAISEPPPRLGKTEDLIWLVEQYNGNVYLSGMGGKHYIDEAQFADHGIALDYMDGHWDRCSILTRIFAGTLDG